MDSVLIGGRESVEITISEPDPQWSERFAALRARITDALGGTALEVHHIGSTAVPGLAAKPIIDVLLLVHDLEDEAAYVPPLEAAGLVLRVREPGHRLLRPPDRTAHVHVSEPDARLWRTGSTFATGGGAGHRRMPATRSSAASPSGRGQT